MRQVCFRSFPGGRKVYCCFFTDINFFSLWSRPPGSVTSMTSLSAFWNFSSKDLALLCLNGSSVGCDWFCLVWKRAFISIFTGFFCGAEGFLETTWFCNIWSFLIIVLLWMWLPLLSGNILTCLAFSLRWIWLPSRAQETSHFVAHSRVKRARIWQI